MADPSGEEPAAERFAAVPHNNREAPDEAERADGARLLIVTGASVADVEELPALVRSLIASGRSTKKARACGPSGSQVLADV